MKMVNYFLCILKTHLRITLVASSIETLNQKLYPIMLMKQKPKGDCWLSTVPVGHYVLATTVARMCKLAGIGGYKTNHSLRVTAAPRQFQAGVDEQLLMKRTGHRSLESERIYKRPSENKSGKFHPFCSRTLLPRLLHIKESKHFWRRSRTATCSLTYLQLYRV